jgi:nucleoside-diphosphate-sugar epimerase
MIPDKDSFFMGKRALVTGGAGFIGSHLCAALAARGAAVTVLDNFATGSRANLAGLDVRLVEGDVADLTAVETAITDCDLVFHQAALVSVPQSLENPALNQRSNVAGTFNVLEAARRAGVKRVVYASSSAVYGDGPGLPKRETDPPQPISPYGGAKQIGEQLAAMYRRVYGLEPVGLRYMNVFGPRQDPSSPYSGVLSIFCQAVLSGAVCRVYGDGEQTRDFVYVADVVAANLLAAAAPYAVCQSLPVFNVGNGRQTSLNDVLRRLGEITGQPPPVVYEPARPGDIRHSVADTGWAAEALGFAAQVPFADGLRQTLAWFTSGGDNR